MFSASFLSHSARSIPKLGSKYILDLYFMIDTSKSISQEDRLFAINVVKQIVKQVIHATKLRFLMRVCMRLTERGRGGFFSSPDLSQDIKVLGLLYGIRIRIDRYRCSSKSQTL